MSFFGWAKHVYALVAFIWLLSSRYAYGSQLLISPSARNSGGLSFPRQLRRRAPCGGCGCSSCGICSTCGSSGGGGGYRMSGGFSGRSYRPSYSSGRTMGGFGGGFASSLGSMMGSVNVGGMLKGIASISGSITPSIHQCVSCGTPTVATSTVEKVVHSVQTVAAAPVEVVKEVVKEKPVTYTELATTTVYQTATVCPNPPPPITVTSTVTTTTTLTAMATSSPPDTGTTMSSAGSFNSNPLPEFPANLASALPVGLGNPSNSPTSTFSRAADDSMLNSDDAALGKRELATVYGDFDGTEVDNSAYVSAMESSPMKTSSIDTSSSTAKKPFLIPSESNTAVPLRNSNGQAVVLLSSFAVAFLYIM